MWALLLWSMGRWSERNVGAWAENEAGPGGSSRRNRRVQGEISRVNPGDAEHRARESGRVPAQVCGSRLGKMTSDLSSVASPRASEEDLKSWGRPRHFKPSRTAVRATVGPREAQISRQFSASRFGAAGCCATQAGSRDTRRFSRCFPSETFLLRGPSPSSEGRESHERAREPHG